MMMNTIAALVLLFVGFSAVLDAAPPDDFSRNAAQPDAAQPNPAKPAHHQLAAEYSAAKLGIACLVMIDGKVAFEQYDNGGMAGWPHELASGTKSFTGVVAAIAADDRLLDFDEPVADTIVEWRTDSRKNAITVRQLLSLTAGLQTAVGIVPTFADAIAKPANEDPGADFSYGATAYQVFGELLRRKLEPKNVTVEQYYRTKLFEPLEMGVARWRTGRDGNPHLPSGISMSARDWAKFGQLVIQQGKWQGQQIVSWKNLSQCFVGSEANPGYGLTWWLAKPVPMELVGRERVVRRGTDLYRSKFDAPSDLVLAAGAGNQRLYVCPSLKLVVVRQAVGIRQALTGHDIGYSDVEFLARLLFGLGADGQVAATGDQLEIVDATAEARFLRRLQGRADKNGDGELSANEVRSLSESLTRLEALFGR
jgi:CubicO group peptidase (beta-lactamase class C family)